MALDEGGFIAEDLVPGGDSPVVSYGKLAVKRQALPSFRLIVETTGGTQLSQPPRQNTTSLAQATHAEILKTIKDHINLLS
jgi:carboxypeptidase PM20D1